MTDYGRDLEFGVSVAPLADPPDWAARTARAPTALVSTSSESRIIRISDASSTPGRSSRRSFP
jgi:hypothetical protein